MNFECVENLELILGIKFFRQIQNS